MAARLPGKRRNVWFARCCPNPNLQMEALAVLADDERRLVLA